MMNVKKSIIIVSVLAERVAQLAHNLMFRFYFRSNQNPCVDVTAVVTVPSVEMVTRVSSQGDS